MAKLDICSSYYYYVDVLSLCLCVHVCVCPAAYWPKRQVALSSTGGLILYAISSSFQSVCIFSLLLYYYCPCNQQRHPHNTKDNNNNNSNNNFFFFVCVLKNKQSRCVNNKHYYSISDAS